MTGWPKLIDDLHLGLQTVQAERDQLRAEVERQAKQIEALHASSDARDDAIIAEAARDERAEWVNQLKHAMENLTPCDQLEKSWPREPVQVHEWLGELLARAKRDGERIVNRLVECYRARPVEVAAALDEHVDRSGNLLGWVRDAAMTSAAPPEPSPSSTASGLS